VTKPIEITPHTGKLGVLTPGMGAVATTLYAGVFAARKGIAEPVGSLTQTGHIRLGKRTDQRSPLIRQFVPLAPLEDIVFGGWDPYSDDAYTAAMKAGVLRPEHLEAVGDELRMIKPMKAVFSHRWVSRLDDTDNVMDGGSMMSQVETLIEDMERFKVEHGCDRLVIVWCGSTEAYEEPSEVHSTLDSFEEGLRTNHPQITPSQIYAYAALLAGVPFANGSPNLTVDIPAMVELASRQGVPIAG
jgi:myo-inositol-1-phosphate synthase